MSRYSNITKQKTSLSVIILLISIMLLGGSTFQLLYKISPKEAIKLTEITNTVNYKCEVANKRIDEISTILELNKTDSLEQIITKNSDLPIMVFKDRKLIAWSNNSTQPEYIESENWVFDILSNTSALVKSKKISNYNIVACIPIKSNFVYENRELKNRFATGFDIDKRVSVKYGSAIDKFAIKSKDGTYLFSLILPETPIFNESYAIVALTLFSIGFLLFFYLIAQLPFFINRSRISIKEYLQISLSAGVVVMLLIISSTPSTLFSNEIFTPYIYSSNSILKTLTHLTFISLYIFAIIFLYYKYTIKAKAKAIFKNILEVVELSIPVLYFIMIFNFGLSIIFNSTTEINLLNITNFSLPAIWNNCLFLLWGVSLYLLSYKIHKDILTKNSIKRVIIIDLIIWLLTVIAIYLFLDLYKTTFALSFIISSISLYVPVFLKRKKVAFFVWLFLFTLLITSNSILLNEDKKFDQYRVLAENHHNGDSSQTGKITEILMETLSKEIQLDKKLNFLSNMPDKLIEANSYFKEKYLRGVWNKYDVRLFYIKKDTKIALKYRDEIDRYGLKVENSNFYSIKKSSSNMSYLGKFNIKSARNDMYIFLEFYPKKNYRSYSFPDLLREHSPDIYTRLNLSTAKYQYRNLKNLSGKFQYPDKATWIVRNNKEYFMQQYNGYKHYIYKPDIYNIFVVSELDNGGIIEYGLYIIYVFLFYISLIYTVMQFGRIGNNREKKQHKYTSKYLYSFILLLLFGLIFIFYFSVNYMRTKYQEQQKHNLEQTKNYVQSYLQENYYWIEHIDSTFVKYLEYDLQNLSYIYQTDIHVYNNDGKLIGTSQPTIFSKKLVSKQISPIPFFSKKENINIKEKIGDLEYLTAYTYLYNGDFLQLGYIAIPQYFSTNILAADIKSFLSVIVQGYLLIILIFIILSYFIAKRLSEPLELLQNSLKQIKLGETSKLIKYKPNDEIRQLVEQYNVTVVELEKSAKKLAHSERDSAWRTMARQVAHEINNPLTPMKLSIQHLQRVKNLDRERFESMFQNTSDMLIEQIENLTRIAASFSNFAKMPETILTKVDVAAKLFNVVTLFKESDTETKYIYSGEQNGIYILADREQITQVFNNLIKNATQSISANFTGQISISIEVINGYVKISIKDNGKGIPEKLREDIFLPNFTTKSSGTGLGLYITKSFIEIIGGTISLISEEGKGTEFNVSIPLLNDSK